MTAESGHAFMVLEVTITPCGGEIGFSIYAREFHAIRTVLLVYDSYTVGDLNETVFGDGYMMTIPRENRSRKTE